MTDRSAGNKRAREKHEAFSAAVEPVTLKTVFPNTLTGKDLHMVARAIGGRRALGLKRQTFFVQRGGWDHHSEAVYTAILRKRRRSYRRRFIR